MAASTPERIIFICAKCLPGFRCAGRAVRCEPASRRIHRLAGAALPSVADPRSAGVFAQSCALHLCAGSYAVYSQEAFPAVRVCLRRDDRQRPDGGAAGACAPWGISIRPQRGSAMKRTACSPRGACRRLDLRPGRRLGAGSPRHRRAHGAAAARGETVPAPVPGRSWVVGTWVWARRRVRLGAGALGDRPATWSGCRATGAARWRVGLGGRPLAPPRQRLRLALARRRSRRRGQLPRPVPARPDAQLTPA